MQIGEEIDATIWLNFSDQDSLITYHTILWSISPQLNHRRFWKLWYHCLHPWFTVEPVFDKSSSQNSWKKLFALMNPNSKPYLTFHLWTSPALASKRCTVCWRKRFGLRYPHIWITLIIWLSSFFCHRMNWRVRF